jgi:hypothetical protein
MELQIFLWALAGGMLVAALSSLAVVLQKDKPTLKHMGRDFILGAAFTGLVYPFIPETFEEVKEVVTSKAGDLVSSVASTAAAATSGDPGIQIGPPNF